MLAFWFILAAVVIVAGALAGVVAARRRRRVVPPEAPPAPARPTVAPDGKTTAPPVVEVPPDTAPPVAEAPTEAPPESAAPPSFRDRLGRARGAFSGLRAVRGRGAVEAATWDELEATLLRADVGVVATEAMLADLRRRVGAGEVRGGGQLLDALRADLIDLLEVEDRWDAATDGDLAVSNGDAPPPDPELVAPVGRSLRFDGEPGVVDVWLFVGVNGVGKTTTVGKVARRESAEGRSVLLAAGDTFRAAAGEQLAMWADRVGVEVVRGAEGGDPSAIVFDAVQRAAARDNDLVLADTAGRLHTKVNLVEELKKIRRVADRPPGRVTEVLLVLDATTGQNGLVQAKQFTDAVAVTGVVLTKLDGTAKGGVVVAVQRELGLPVKLVGLGEGADDLVPFSPEQFVDALLG
ncbi:MAG TPA: signal recognition particle-docking protein FtsY [Acidimicrobiales bacterium]|nr:signal recognition particle-docking protein FtsY [Acidimicrobiales bacterium]